MLCCLYNRNSVPQLVLFSPRVHFEARGSHTFQRQRLLGPRKLQLCWLSHSVPFAHARLGPLWDLQRGRYLRQRGESAVLLQVLWPAGLVPHIWQPPNP